jgi:hypothetical protein
MERALFCVFIALALFFTAFLFYFVSIVGRMGKGFLRAKIFLNTDPILKVFYQFFIGAALSYMMFMMYALDMRRTEWFIFGEVFLGLSLIGFSYLMIPLFLKKKD